MPKAFEFTADDNEQVAIVDNITPAPSTKQRKESRGMVLGAQGQDCWVTFDGTTPSATNGIRIINGAQPVQYNFAPKVVNGLKAVSVVASAAKLDIVWLQ